MSAPSSDRELYEALPPRHRKAAEWVRGGLSNHKISEVMGTSEAVIKNYLKDVFAALGVSSRLELAILLTNMHRDAAEI